MVELESFNILVVSGEVLLNVMWDFMVKVDVIGLNLGICYFYCFCSVFFVSVVGEIKILSGDVVNEVIFGVFFCFNYFVGFFIFYVEVVK